MYGILPIRDVHDKQCNIVTAQSGITMFDEYPYEGPVSGGYRLVCSLGRRGFACDCLETWWNTGYCCSWVRGECLSLFLCNQIMLLAV